MAVNWNLGGGGAQNALAMFQMGNQMGRQAKAAQRESETRNALATIFGEQTGGGQAQLPGAISASSVGTFDTNGQQVTPVQQGSTPDTSGAWQTLLQNDPKMAMQLRHQQQTQQAEQRKTGQEQMLVVGKLLNSVTDEASYQRALGAARQYGLDLSRVPQAYDPAWVDQQKMIVSSLGKGDGKPHYWESNDGSLMAIGPDGKPTEVYHDPVAKYVPDGLGGLKPIPGTGGRATPKIIAQRPQNMTDDQLIAQAHEAARNGANVEDVFRQLQAWGVNP